MSMTPDQRADRIADIRELLPAWRDLAAQRQRQAHREAAAGEDLHAAGCQHAANEISVAIVRLEDELTDLLEEQEHGKPGMP